MKPEATKFEDVKLCGKTWSKATYNNGEVAYGIDIGPDRYRIAHATIGDKRWQPDERDMNVLWAALPIEPTRTVRDAAKAILNFDRERKVRRAKRLGFAA